MRNPMVKRTSRIHWEYAKDEDGDSTGPTNPLTNADDTDPAAMARLQLFKLRLLHSPIR